MNAESDREIPGITIRTDLRPGDLGMIVYLHGTVYARERGFDPTFEAYVAGPFAEFVRTRKSRERLWIAERRGEMVGCIAIVAASEEAAQLRWFLVTPRARGIGLGKRLLMEAISFCNASNYRRVILWTESVLTVAARLYASAGFHKVEDKPSRMGGVDVIEQQYELIISP
jgi:N-acetylglutamate synthase-like GNAT family acetyltransferase